MLTHFFLSLSLSNYTRLKPFCVIDKLKAITVTLAPSNPTTSQQISPSTSSKIPTSPGSVPRTDPKIGTGVGASVSLILLLLLGWYLLRQHRRRRIEATAKAHEKQKHQAYLQSKAELEDEHNRIYELEAPVMLRPELEHQAEMQEMGGNLPSAELGDKVPVKKRQELQGQDGCKELDVSKKKDEGGDANAKKLK